MEHATSTEMPKQETPDTDPLMTILKRRLEAGASLASKQRSEAARLAVLGGSTIGGTGLLAGFAEAIDELSGRKLAWIVTTAVFLVAVLSAVAYLVWWSVRPAARQAREALEQLVAAGNAVVAAYSEREGGASSGSNSSN